MAHRVTCRRLKELLRYEPKTGLFTWRVRKAICIVPGMIAGCRDHEGYLLIGIDYVMYRAHRLAWLYMTGRWPPAEIDHKNRKTGDNRWTNLRCASTKQNGENRKVAKNNVSGVTGVSRYGSQWRALIYHNRRKIHLGTYTTIALAARARRAAEDRLYTHHR